MKLQKLIQEEIDAQINEARLIYLKKLAHDIVTQFFPHTSGVGPLHYEDGKQMNRFRAELETQIAAAISGVIKRHNRGQYVIDKRK